MEFNKWNNTATRTAKIDDIEIPTSAVEEISFDVNAPVEYYNLQGIKVVNPGNGIYIKKQGLKAVKVIL